MLYISPRMTESEKADLVLLGDRLFDEQLERVSSSIIAGTPDGMPYRFVTLAGPSCSGKTTASKKLELALEHSGREVHSVSIDDFYFSRDVLQNRTPGIVPDYDSPDTINVDELSSVISSIMEQGNGEIDLPTFDFLVGSRVDSRHTKFTENDIFIFEGIQAMYSNVSPLFSGVPTARIFINVTEGINCGGRVWEPDNIRLLRRLVRDFYKRGADPDFTMDLWKNVRSNEAVHIYPHASEADYFINSVMPYELGMLKGRLISILSRADLSPEYNGFRRTVLDAFDEVDHIDEKLISPDSLYNEFINRNW